MSSGRHKALLGARFRVLIIKDSQRTRTEAAEPPEDRFLELTRFSRGPLRLGAQSSGLDFLNKESLESSLKGTSDSP